MSNVEHLFENAIVALENDYYFGEWKRIEKDRHNTDGVSEEVLEAIWELAIYTKYTYEPSLNAIPIEWIEKWGRRNTWYYGNKDNVITMLLSEWRCKQRVEQANKILEDWEKENETN